MVNPPRSRNHPRPAYARDQRFSDFKRLEANYMTRWNVVKGLSIANYRLDLGLGTDNPESGRIAKEQGVQFGRLFEQCDEMVLEMGMYGYDYRAIRRVIGMHRDLAAQTSEITGARTGEFGLEYRPIDDTFNTLDFLKDRWLKKSYIIETLIMNSSAYHLMLPATRATRRIMVKRYQVMMECMKAFDEKLFLIAATHGLSQLRQGFLEKHVKIREKFKNTQKNFLLWYRFAADNSDSTSDRGAQTPTESVTPYLKEFLETAELMFQVYEDAKENDLDLSDAGVTLYRDYLKSLRKLDKTLDKLRRRRRITPQVLELMTEIRSAIPIPPNKVQFSRFKYTFMNISHDAVQDFCDIVQQFVE